MAAKKANSKDVFNQLVQEISSNQLKPVYYLFGEEEFYLDQLLDKFSEVLPVHERDFNFDLLYGQDLTLGKVISIAKSYPMMAERRVLIVRNFLQAGKGGDDLQNFIHYLEHPNPTCLLVLFDTGKPAANTNLGKALAKNKNVGYHQFESLADYLIPDWVIAWVQSHHKKQIAPAAAQLLAQFVGNNLQLLSTEIDKVCTFVDTSDSVSEADVKKIIGSYREYTAIELGIASAWYFNKLWDDASNFSYSDMPRVFEALLDADRSIKGFSTLDSTSILFFLVKRIIG